jgi:hypothetical protein
MKLQYRRPKLVTAVLAILVVFFMSTGVFVGAVEQDLLEEETINRTTILNEAGETDERLVWQEDSESGSSFDLDEETKFKDLNKNFKNPQEADYSTEIIPESSTQFDMMGETQRTYTTPDGKVVVVTGDELNSELLSASDDSIEYTISSSVNPISDAMTYIIPENSESNSDLSTIETNIDQPTRASTTKTMILGSDNPNQPGAGSGYIYKSSSSYRVYDGYYMYSYMSSYSEYRGFSVFDLSDLTDYEGVTITSGAILIRNYQRYYVLGAEFYSLNTIPQDGNSGTPAQKAFEEAGGLGTTKIAEFNTKTSTDNSYKDMYFTITSGGITHLNDKLSKSDLTYAFGSVITNKASTTPRWYMYDVRLVLNFTATSEPVVSNEVAVANDLAGYVTSSTKYDFGRIYSSSSSYRGFAVWDTSAIKSLVPLKNSDDTDVILKKIALRVNSPYGYLRTLGIYNMKNNPRTSSALSIYSDAADGSRYAYFPTGSTSTMNEFEWDLGPQALADFNESFADDNPDFFGLGFSRSTSYIYLYGAKLVVYYKLKDPATKTINFGSDNPKYAGDSMGYLYGYLRSTSATHRIYTQYNSYFRYYKGSTYAYDHRGYAVFDLTQLDQWSGVKVESANLLIRSVYRYAATGIDLYSLKTTPYYGASSSTAKAMWDQAGGTGTTKVGTYTATTSRDYTKHDVTVPINSAGITELNSLLSSTSKTKSFQIGGKITTIATGYTSATVNWHDIRLIVKFSFTAEPTEPTKTTPGLQFGDTLSGYASKYISSSNYPDGRMYIRYSTGTNYRGYAQWDVSDIKAGMPSGNIILTGINLVVNNDYGTPKLDIYPMKNNVSKTTTSAATIFTDCGDGTPYIKGANTGGNDIERNIDLGTQALSDFQDAFEDDSPDFFGLGFVSSSTSSIVMYGPKLMISWKYRPKSVIADAGGPYVGKEGTPVTFNASKSQNLSQGTGGLKYSWDWNNDAVFDDVTTNPLINHLWSDDYTGNITLLVNDTIANKWAMTNTTLTIENVPPTIVPTSGRLSPQPVLEANDVTFQDFKFEDPGTDSWTYFWDFDSNGTFDASGNLNQKTIPKETWFYEDDIQGEATLVVVDDDGGTTNITYMKQAAINPQSSATGYVLDSGYSYPSNYVYVEWRYSTDYRRGWAKFDLSSLPEGAIIKKVEFNGYVAYAGLVTGAGIRLLKTDPTTRLYSQGMVIYNEAGSGTRLGGITWSTGSKTVDLGTAGVTAVNNALTDGWVAFGFDEESPTTFGQYYGYMYGYSSIPMALKIDYELMEPGFTVPVLVKNVPPVIDPTNMTMTPTEVNEGENITLTNISFYDPGNDTYEYNVSVGSYWTGWQPMGGAKPPVASTDNIAPKATPSASRGGSGAYGPASMNDLNVNNMCWVSTPTGGSATAFFQLTWSQKYNIGKMKVIQHGTWSNPGNRNLAGCDVQYWDGSKWVTDGTLTGLNSDFEYTFKQARFTDRIRMTNLKVTGSQASNPCVYEWYVYSAVSSGGGAWGVFGPGHHNYNLTINITVPDDHPLSGTSADDVPVTVFVRDDDHNVLVKGTGLADVIEPKTVQSQSISSSAISYNNGRNLVVDSDNVLYVIYRARLTGDSYYQIYLARSDDGGSNWEHIKISTPDYFQYDYQYSPAIAVDSNDVLHVVWYGEVSGSSAYNIRYARSTDGGSTWSLYNVTTYTSYDRYYPSIAVDSKDNVHIVWYGRHSSSYNNNIYYRTRSSTGTWGTETMITSHAYSLSLYQYRPSVEVDTKDNVHVVWYGYFSSSLRYYNIQYAIKWSSNSTWSKPIALTTDSTYHNAPTLTTDASNNVHVVWYGRDSVATGNYNIMYKNFNATTNSWGGKEYITKYTTSVYQNYPTISVNQAGVIDVLWYGRIMPSGTTPYIIRHAQKTSTGWSSDENYYSFSSNYQYYPNLLGQAINSKAKSGFAYVWVDSTVLKFDTSEDFIIGTPEFLNGLDSHDMTLRVNNVVPELNSSAMSNLVAFEQTDFDFMVLFKDPGLGATTEIFEYNIDWGDGTSSGWTVTSAKTADELLSGRNPETGYAYGTTLEETYSFNDQLITYVFVSFYSADSDTYDIDIEGFNKNTNAWESIYSYYGFSSPGDFERTFTTPVYTKWRISFADYENNDNIYYTYKFRVEDFSYSGYGFFIANHIYLDDMPTATPEDKLNLVVEFRDDDLGYDKVNGEVTVKNIAPVVNMGMITPDLTYGMDEGDILSLEYFTFDDKAFEEPTETFEYQIDWGDGTVTNGGWADDFEMAGIGGEIFTVEPNVYTSASTNYNNGRKVVMDDKGTLYAIKTHRGTTSSYYQVFVSVSDDYGETWTEYEVTTDSVSNNQYQYYPSLGIDSQGVLHVVWQAYVPVPSPYSSRYSVRYANSSDGGKTWGNFSVIDLGKYYYSYPVYFYNYEENPAIAIDSNDVVHLAWRHYNYSYNYATRVRRYEYGIKYVNNSGGIFGTPSEVYAWNGSASPYLYQYSPSITVDQSNNVHVVWYGYHSVASTRAYNILYRKLDATTGWQAVSAVTSVTSSTYSAYRPCITADLDGNLHVVWYQRGTSSSYYQIWYRMFDATTSSWGTTTQLSSGLSYYQYYPTVGVDQRGFVYVAWYGGSPYTIYLATKPVGGSFGTPEDITSDSTFSSQYYPNLLGFGANCIPERGTGLVWTGYSNGRYDVMFYGTQDFFLGFGPLKGIPKLTHLYRDDNPTGTDTDPYMIIVRVRDDDTGVGELMIPFEIRNVMPTILSDIELVAGNESSVLLPAVEFMDPGSNAPPRNTGEADILLEGFESGNFTGGLWSAGAGWSVGINDQRTGTYFLEASGDHIDSELTLDKDLDLTDYKNVKLVFWQYTYATENTDIFNIDVSTDTGSSWITIASWDGSVLESITQTYSKFELDLSAFDGESNFRLRFRFTMSTSLEWWRIDDIEMSGDLISIVTSEVWHYWWDMDNDGALNGPDITGTVEDIIVKDNVSYCRIPEIVATHNDDYDGKANLFIYDDDTSGDWQYKAPIYLPGFDVTDATVEFYQWANVWDKINWSTLGYPGGPLTYSKDMSVYQNLGPWAENTVNWTNYPVNTGNMNFVPEDTLTLAERKILGIGDEYPSGGSAHWEGFDLTDLTYDWLEGDANNYGISVLPTMLNNNQVAWEHTTYYSSGSPAYVSPTLKPKLTINVDEDNDGFPDTNYVLQPSDGKDAWISQCSLNTSIMRESGSDIYLLSNLYSTSIGYSSIGSFFRRGLIEFNLSTINWRAENTVTWDNPSFNLTCDIKVANKVPYIVDHSPDVFLPGDIVDLDIDLVDDGSDDLFARWDWGDEDGGSTSTRSLNSFTTYYNNGATPEPTYPPKHSAFNGTAPFIVRPKLTHIYFEPGTYYVNFSLYDDDSAPEFTNYSKEIKIPTAQELKEEAIRLLEPLVPGRDDVVGYKNLTLQASGDLASPFLEGNITVLAYNHISRPPYFWETRLMYTFCNIGSNSTIFVDASSLPEGMFGNKLILKAYNRSKGLLDEQEIPTLWSCLDQLKTGQEFGWWTVLEVGHKNGTTYNHYTKIALKVEDAIDNILFSLNRDPRRGYGWWHTHWAFYCGYWFERSLWVDELRLDPVFGSIVFNEERRAVTNLMTVINNVLKPDGVHNLTFRWDGKRVVDIEVFTYGVWWKWWEQWEHTDTFKGIKPGEEFFIGSRGYPLCGKLGKRTLIKVHKNSTGELLDAQMLRTSGFWPLEMEIGNVYGNLIIVNSTMKLGCGNFWRTWFGDWSVWDFTDWSSSRSPCPSTVKDCWNDTVAAEEEARIASNLSKIKAAIKMLVMADDVIARFAYWDAQNLTVVNASNQDEYDYHMKMAKRYMLRARREAGKGRPHRAIRDFKLSWKNSILATKWVIKNYEDPNGTTDPGEEQKWPDFDIDLDCDGGLFYKHRGPWWLWWYIVYQIKLQIKFATFPDWKDYTDPEFWGD